MEDFEIIRTNQYKKDGFIIYPDLCKYKVIYTGQAYINNILVDGHFLHNNFKDRSLINE